LTLIFKYHPASEEVNTMTKKKNGDKDITPIGAHILEILARMPMSFKLIVGDIDNDILLIEF